MKSNPAYISALECAKEKFNLAGIRMDEDQFYILTDAALKIAGITNHKTNDAVEVLNRMVDNIIQFAFKGDEIIANAN